MDQPFWSDHFDLDLTVAVPKAREVLGELGDLEIWTNSSLTKGRINCPSAWNEPEGLTSFFSFRQDAVPPGGRSTMYPSVPCTIWEAFRDLWIHQHLLSLEGVVVWDPTTSSMVGHAFEVLLYGIRKWRPIPEDDMVQARKAVLVSIAQAANLIAHLQFKRLGTGQAGGP
jgi:hypothetical protein